ncbi:phosphatidylglycerophosphatase A family protein [Hydrogenimonas urashimensis]|uniref:phosphatidylglycerophosphatase A family protein n=1 Tax=Hydrogenimonas urashimensis TaxID=2740515 RepID=UPI001915A8AD|nr:phosphatidylglycerophosphatase A [Hydrogenimonas urashimensis]
MNLQEKLFLAGLGSGFLPKAPGTWGTLVGLILGIAMLRYFPAETLFLLTILVFLFGVKMTSLYEVRTGIHDDSRIVIDEIAGIWLALCISGATLPAAFFSFLFFRLYDIWKPSLIGRIDRDAPGGWGVMGDDIVAGAAAGLSSALVLQAIRYFGIAL